ncbi:NAD(P)/FAD-dependent oxidoreductase [Variovorax sp. J31P179]|jgi:2-polyprenyl-6-methoxyphenol hydroxylase-like FAD-dependent oxidoreductase|uniref:FAD-dependent oxidoreductase n=1 Tax=Variovorax sp. J31P179 TaxID=3053508 RepID=UPI00257545C3|nr:NAD(P)/FAD-dependent oxidoreductase [Variovorax sp. J31P179]MDM0079866.1 NAD(P)/FAD-dependent oxidoreductase [Variovorax sp. J31P179]
MQPLQRKLNIGIAGAGPAGLATSIALAGLGHRVEVFEKHPTLEPLGAGLLIQPQGLRALEALGVRRKFDEVSVPIGRLLGTSHRGWRVVDIDYEDAPARAVSRALLARVLYEAARSAGVHFSLARHVESLDVVDGRARATTNAGASDFDLFAIADGAASRLRESAGLAGPSKAYRWGALWGQFWVPAWKDSGVLLQRFRGTSEMMGLLPTELSGSAVRLSFFWSIRGDRYAAWRSADLAGWRAHVLSLWPESEPVVSQIRHHDDLAFATYRHTWPRSMGAGPLCVVGDAAHAMSPQLGLGTTLAVEDALALAQAVAQHGAMGATQAFSSRRLRRSQSFQTLSRLLTPCFQAQGAGVWRDVAFATGLRIPGVPWLMKRSLAAPARSHPGGTAAAYPPADPSRPAPLA